MEKSIEKIKQALEQKRKNNIELLNKLKEKSIILNAEKEKQKRYFLNKTLTFLNKKRKNSNLIESDINTTQIKNNENISYEAINAYEDYDEYYEDFMNNSFMTNKIFNNLNFCRPERFSLNKNKKKKLLIKNEQEFTIKKTIKPKEISSVINMSFEGKIKKNDTPFITILEKKNNDVKKKDKEISFFDINDNNNNDNKEEQFLRPIAPINNNNEKSLFGSNITEKNKEINNNENKEININNDNNNNKEKKEENKLFGNIERLNSIENKDKTLFGDMSNNINKEKTPTPKKEEKKELAQSSDLGLFAVTPTPTPEPDKEKKEEKKETKKNESISLFSKEDKEKEKNNKSLFNNEEKKEKIILPPLIDKEEKEKENKENKKSLFGNTNFGFNTQTKRDNNDSNNNKPIQENGNKTPLFSGSLLGSKGKFIES